MANKTRPQKKRKKAGGGPRGKASRVKGEKGTQMSNSGSVRSEDESEVSKSSFIRSMPTNSAPEIIRMYKELHGGNIAPSLVYNVRNAEKKKAAEGKSPSTKAEGKSPSTKGDATSTKAASKGNRTGVARRDDGAPVAARSKRPVTPLSVDPDLESVFSGVVLRIGLDRAELILKQLRASLEVYVATPGPRSPLRHSGSNSAGASSRAKESRASASAN